MSAVTSLFVMETLIRKMRAMLRKNMKKLMAVISPKVEEEEVWRVLKRMGFIMNTERMGRNPRRGSIGL